MRRPRAARERGSGPRGRALARLRGWAGGSSAPSQWSNDHAADPGRVLRPLREREVHDFEVRRLSVGWRLAQGGYPRGIDAEGRGPSVLRDRVGRVCGGARRCRGAASDRADRGRGRRQCREGGTRGLDGPGRGRRRPEMRDRGDLSQSHGTPSARGDPVSLDTPPSSPHLGGGPSSQVRSLAGARPFRRWDPSARGEHRHDRGLLPAAAASRSWWVTTTRGTGPLVVRGARPRAREAPRFRGREPQGSPRPRGQD